MDNSYINELNSILQNFSVPQKVYNFKSINIGLINYTYVVFELNKPKYILQRINTSVFKNVKGLMHNYNNVIKLLNSNSHSEFKIYNTNDNTSFYTLNDDCWRLISFVKNSISYNTTSEEKIAFEAGKLVGNFHALLQNENPNDYIETIPQFHNLQLRLHEFKQAYKKASFNKIDVTKSEVDFVQKTAPFLTQLNNASLPIRICHNDTKLNNMLFSKDSNKGLYLIDLDTVMPGYFYYDFGDAIRTLVNSAKEDEKDLEKITFNTIMFEQFIKGLKISDLKITTPEIASLQYGAVYMPFIHGLRALTDYLNNNVYYQVSYENQNLDRCKSLFKLAKLAKEKIPYMSSSIKKELIV